VQFNPGKTCDAVLRPLEAREGAARSNICWSEECGLTRVRRASAFASYRPEAAIPLSADTVEKALDERLEY
jgi:hypothetical protein